MGIEVTKLRPDETDDWNRYVDRSSSTMPLHRFEALLTIAEASNTNLHPLVGRKGQEPVGILPLFEKRKGPFQFVYSPPTELQIPYLGPALIGTEQLKQRKAEKWNHRFIGGCIEWIDENLDADHVDVRTTDRFPDARSFIWNGFDVEPAYTYVVDITPGKDELLQRFSSGARRRIVNADTDAYTIEEDGENAIRQVLRQLQRRHENNSDETYTGVDPEFAVDLYDALPEGQFRPYVCRVNDEFAGGILTFESHDTVYTWRGGAKPDLDLPVNELTDWKIMREAAERGKTRYDFVGAMKPRLCEYKAKFAPEPKLLYMARRKSQRMQVLSTVYNKMPEQVQSTLGV